MRYTSDLTDTEWQLIDYCFPEPGQTGRSREHSYRELLNGIFYLTKTACQWRNLPENFAPWGTVYHYFRTWKRNGLWVAIQPACGNKRPSGRAPSGRGTNASQRGPSSTARVSKAPRRATSGVTTPARKSTGEAAHPGRYHWLASHGNGFCPPIFKIGMAPKQLLAAFFSRKITGASNMSGPTAATREHCWIGPADCGAAPSRSSASDLHTFKVLAAPLGGGTHLRMARTLPADSIATTNAAKTGETMVYLAMIRLMLARLGRQ